VSGIVVVIVGIIQPIKGIACLSGLTRLFAVAAMAAHSTQQNWIHYDVRLPGIKTKQ
jgi:hypothetical protein